MKNREQFEKYLSLFGLDSGFDEEELKRSYRLLAKLNHPDLNKDNSSKVRMILINEGYAYLKENISSPMNKTPEKQATDDYSLYKNAFDLMKDAFDNFSGYGNSYLKNNRPELKKRFIEAKSLFAELIEKYPESAWVSDSIDRVFTINAWIE